jgi:hypothetical protein
MNAANEGLSSISLPILSGADISLPYYGNLLFHLTEEAGRETFKELTERGAAGAAPMAEELQFTQDLILQIAAAQGISDNSIAVEANETIVDRGVQNWKVVLAALRLLDRIEGIGQSSIELFTRDVWYYLSRKGLRLQINALVNEAIPQEAPCVVVSHSLGTIVAYNILMNRPNRSNIKALITIGSPLGIGAIFTRLPSDSPPRKSPDGVAVWFNARDARDVVALYEISSDQFRGAPVVTNYSGVNNTSENKHGIVEYLKDSTIAKAIHSVTNTS